MAYPRLPVCFIGLHTYFVRLFTKHSCRVTSRYLVQRYLLMSPAIRFSMHRPQERRTYIPQGWTKFYEFSYGDIRAGSFVMEVGAWVDGCVSGLLGGCVAGWLAG